MKIINILVSLKPNLKIFKFLPVFLFLTMTSHVSFAEISVGSYCNITIDSMNQELSNYQDLITLANQYADDFDAFMQQEAIKRAQLDQARDALYSSYGTTADEYVLYMGENKKAVDVYLNANPGIKLQIDDLSVQVNSLMDNFETLRQSIEPTPPAPPLP